MDLLSVNTTMVTIWGYPLSYIEFAGTALYFASTFLIARKNMWTWPTGIASVVLYFLLFYQIRLYSDMLEQVYYFVVSIVGWVTWGQKREQTPEHLVPSRWSGTKELLLWFVAIASCTLGLTLLATNMYRWLPQLFAQASYPFLDALTTVMSFAAMYLLTIRRNESWLYWIVVDVIGIWLYWVKGLHFISIQYVFLLANAVHGLAYWLKKPGVSGQGTHDAWLP